MKAKYELLLHLLQSTPFTPDQQTTAARFAVKGINHAQNDVRTPAYDCMGELYRQMGANDLAKHYEGLRQAQLDQLMAKFEEIDNGGAAVAKKPQPKAQRKVTVSTNIGKKGGAVPKNSDAQYAD